MLLSRANGARILTPRITFSRCFSSAVHPENEYTTTPQYPEILDLSRDKVLERRKEAEYQELKNVSTVEEKQIKLNMPFYYGCKCYVMEENLIPYNNLTLAQSITRTHLIQKPSLPEFYKNLNLDEGLSKQIQAELEEEIGMTIDGIKRIHELKSDDISLANQENILTSSISKAINRVLVNTLSSTLPHLIKTQIDVDSRIESCWYAGGMVPPEIVKKYRLGQPWQKDKVDEPSNRLINYLGSANLALRTDKPLLPIVPHADAENPDLEVPHFPYDPRAVGTRTTHKHIANIPGYWPGDPNNFGVLSYHSRGHLLEKKYPVDDTYYQDALHRQGILASFAWLNSQANFLGFTTFNDITYPLVTQTIITNGKYWSFYVYQLNTMVNHSKYFYENKKKNICWATPQLKLFDEIKDGKIINFNNDVFNVLLQFYLNAPEHRLGVNLTPYLSKEAKFSADYEHEEKREWLEREYKYLVANRPRIKLTPEIYSWEKIYKIDNDTRFLDKKLRPFELKIDPFARRLDDRKPRYIPRKLRPDLPRHKGRDANEYFP